jgi:hypothetical protein
MKKVLLLVTLALSIGGFSQCYHRSLGNVYNRQLYYNSPVYVRPQVYVRPLVLPLFVPRVVERPEVMYYYYPEADVYYNPTSKTYSYYLSDGWITVERLPEGFPLPQYWERVYCSPGENIWSYNYLHRRRR